jgi:hypothetical protein
MTGTEFANTLVIGLFFITLGISIFLFSPKIAKLWPSYNILWFYRIFGIIATLFALVFTVVSILFYCFHVTLFSLLVTN